MQALGHLRSIHFLLLGWVLACGPTLAAEQIAVDLYKTNCAICHDDGLTPQVPGGPTQTAQAPSRAILRLLLPEQIFLALDKGSMTRQGSQLSVTEKRLLAEYLTEKRFSAKPEDPIPASAYCNSSGSPFQSSLAGSVWNGWGVTPDNRRYQPDPGGLSAANVPRLKLKWAFGFPGESSASTQPVVAGGRLYIGSIAGNVYSLDARTGCIHWRFVTKAGVRSAAVLGKGPSGVLTVFFGDLQNNVYAVNAATGKPLWQVRVEDHPISRITGSPTLYNGTLYVPVASREESQPSNPEYECCTARGSLVALNALTGKRLWKSYVIADPPRPIQKNAAGTQMYGPSGGGIWSAPTIDAKLQRIYVGTGNNYSPPARKTTDAIVAFDMKTGKLLWSQQSTPGDVWNGSCMTRSPDHSNCPLGPSPDFDYGSSPVLTELPGGRRMLVAAGKSGVAHGLDPDRQGQVIWDHELGSGGFDEGVIWGSASDGQKMYVALDTVAGNPSRQGGGLFALDLSSGKTLWSTPTPACGDRKPCVPALIAAVSAMPGVVFAGSVDGFMRAYSSTNGSILWSFDTMRDFTTVNGVPAKGGSISGGGAAIAEGMMFTNSGYSHHGGVAPGNVLLAFAIE